MKHRGAGFTLIEVTVVLVIIGILAGFAVLSLGNRSQDSRFETEARRLETLVSLAAEEAETQGAEIGLRLDAGTYQFLLLSPQGKWEPLQGKNALRERHLPEPFYLDLTLEGRSVKPAPAQQDEELKPQILLLSSGESTAFALELRASNRKDFYRLEGNALGHLKLEHHENQPPA